jgi:meiosis-specific transcription factor NDT80
MQTSHTFDRVQFKCATANNGKRRASQQYFHIHAEVFVDVRKDVNEPPSWVKVAYRISDKIVVRGRSPSHYQNEGGPGSRNGGGNTGNAYPATAAPPTYAGQNTGGFRGMNTYPIRSAGPGGYLPSNYGMHGPGDSPGSDESADGGASDEDQAMDLAAHDSDPMQDTEAYAYYPGSLYDPVSNMTNRLPLPPLPKVESTTPRCSTEPRQYAVTSEYADAIPGPQWGVHPGGRLQGFESSRGFYPDISAGAAGYS